jgi:hypothetical protein
MKRAQYNCRSLPNVYLHSVVPYHIIFLDRGQLIDRSWHATLTPTSRSPGHVLQLLMIARDMLMP